MTSESQTSIVTRKIPFDFSGDLKPHWIPDKPELAHLWNGLSLGMPYLEPYLIRTMREGLKRVKDPQVLADGAGFMAQEGQHYQTHQRYNDFLKRNGYSEIERIEQEMTVYYERLGNRTLARKMAYSAGFESMTLGLTRFLIGERVRLFRNSDTRVASFWLWHMVEETEHKTAAYDAYQHACGGYFTRAFGVIHGTLGVAIPGVKAAILMLKKDGLWKSWRSRMRLAGHLLELLRYAGPYLLRSMLPYHSPRFEKDLDWVTQWLSRYPADVTAQSAPLVDTAHPEMPVPEMNLRPSTG